MRRILCRIGLHDVRWKTQGYLGAMAYFIRWECARGCGAYWIEEPPGPRVRMG